MYQLRVKYQDSIIIDRTLTLKECNSMKSNVVTFEATVNGGRNYNGPKVAKFVVWIMEVFDKFLGIDIKDYRLDELEFNHSFNTFTLFIRQEDFVKLRDDKINQILD